MNMSGFKVVVTLAVVAAVGLASDTYGQTAGKGTQLRVEGSVVLTSILDPVVSQFGKTHPRVKVTLYGSSDPAGFRSLLLETADVALSLREPDSQENSIASQKGVSLVKTVLGYAIGAIIVHPGITLDALTIDQFGKVFGGGYDNWEQVGGPKRPIVVVAMESDAGAKYLSEEVLKTSFSRKAQIVTNYRKMLRMVSERQGAIGFIRADEGYRAAQEGKVKILGIKKDANSPALMPPQGPPVEGKPEGDYPLSRPMLLYYRATGAGTAAKEFVEFCQNAFQEMMRKQMPAEKKK